MAGLHKTVVSVFIFLLTIATIGWFVNLWLFSDAAWLHPEMLGSSAYVWIYPDTEGFFQNLRKIFDWKAFDPNVNRVRPINDVAEVIDSIARPYLTYFLGPIPALTPSAVLTALLAPLCLFCWLKNRLGKTVPAIVLTLLFISTIGFLSCTVASLHPAKRINLTLLCAILFFAGEYAKTYSLRSFCALWVCLFLSLISDELGLANFPIVAILYWDSIFRRKTEAIAFISLPCAFVLFTKFGLPLIYALTSVHGPWNALDDGKKFGYLLSGSFYEAAAIQTARSILSTVGVPFHTAATEIFAGLAFLIISLFGVLKKRFLLWQDDKLFLSAIVFLLVSLYATLLDWYPFLGEVRYLGSSNYYYHSALPVFLVVWMAFAWRTLRFPHFRMNLIMAIVACLIIAANFKAFSVVNDLAKVIHLYPYSEKQIITSLQAASISEKHSVIQFESTPAEVVLIFEHGLKSIFGSDWNKTPSIRRFSR